MKKIVFLISMMVAAVAAFCFTSCNSDDDVQDKEVVYTIAVTSTYDGVPTEAFLNEMESVQHQYDNYFNADREHKFSTMTSDMATNNARIATLASVVNAALQVQTWHYTFKVQISNDNTGEVVYRATYQP